MITTAAIVVAILFALVVGYEWGRARGEANAWREALEGGDLDG